MIVKTSHHKSVSLGLDCVAQTTTKRFLALLHNLKIMVSLVYIPSMVPQMHMEQFACVKQASLLF